MKYSLLSFITFTFISCIGNLTPNNNGAIIDDSSKSCNNDKIINNNADIATDDTNINTPKQTFQPTLDDYIKVWKDKFDDDSEPKQFKLVDIDNDGINEIFMTDGNNIAVATCGNNNVEIIIGGPSDITSIQYDNNKIVTQRHGAGWTYYSGFIISNSKPEIVATEEHLSRYNTEDDTEEETYTYMIGPNIDNLRKSTQSETYKVLALGDSAKYITTDDEWSEF